MTNELHSLLQERNSTFRSGDEALYNTARTNLRRGIKHTREAYQRNIEIHLTDNNPRRVWQGIASTTNYKNNSSSVYADASLAEELNHFFACFEVSKPVTNPLPPSTPSTCHVILQEHEVGRVLRSINTKKATGHDRVSGKVLKACDDQLAGVFTYIFNLSLTLATIQLCFKISYHYPCSKKASHRQPE